MPLAMYENIRQALSPDNFWIVTMGCLVGASCGLLGNYLIFRRMAFIADAMSHSVLPGIVIAFLIAQTRSNTALFLGALGAAVLTMGLIHLVQFQNRIRSDTAIGIVFSTLFAVGIILITVFAHKIDLDQDCVLYGEIAFIGCEPKMRLLGDLSMPMPVLRMAIVFMASLIFIRAFYKELLIFSFDPMGASLLCSRSSLIYYGLMFLVTLVVVCSFEAVGAILVVGMMVLPGATAGLVSHRLPVILALSCLLPLSYSALGLYCAHVYDCSISGAMIAVGLCLFLVTWGLRCLFWRKG